MRVQEQLSDLFTQRQTETGVTRSCVMVQDGELGYANEGPQLNISSPLFSTSIP